MSVGIKVRAMPLNHMPMIDAPPRIRILGTPTPRGVFVVSLNLDPEVAVDELRP